MRLTGLASLLFVPILIVGCEPVKDKPADTDVSDDSGVTDDPDGDGYGIDRDCDNSDPTVHPDAEELCDDKDNDCDDQVDEGALTTFYPDSDGDGSGATTGGVEACEAPAGYVASSDDCNDADAQMAPGLDERCDEKDNDCDGSIDEDVFLATWYRDADADGYGDPNDSIDECGTPEGYVSNKLDCDDTSYFDPVHVAEGGVALPDTGDTGGWDTAFASLPGGAANPLGSIQEGIDLAEACVFVSPGDYLEDIDFRGKDILVLGVDGAGSTTIRGTGNGPVVTFANGESGGAVLRGFTVTGGTGLETGTYESGACGYRDDCVTYTYTYQGGGIYVDDSGPTLADLVVTGNELPPYSYTEVSSTEFRYVYSMGGGIFVSNGTPTLESSVVSLNSADEGGGLWLDATSNVSVSTTAFVENSASSGGGAESAGTFGVTNAIFAFNDGTGASGNFGGAGVSIGGGATTLTNVTLYANASQGGSLYVGASGTAQLMNVIAAVNPLGAVLDGEAGGTLNASYSDVFGGSGSNWGTFPDGTGSSGNISADPDFMSAGTSWATSDLHLAAASPAVDAANPSATYNDTDGSRGDMGAYGGPDGAW